MSALLVAAQTASPPARDMASPATKEKRSTPGGGRCLPSLGQWKRRNGQPNDPKSPSDGYATGLIVFVLREAGVPAMDPAIQRGIAWLKTHQRASGRWFTRSLNDDEDHYITDVGTCLAVMALGRCASAGEPTLTHATQSATDRASSRP